MNSLFYFNFINLSDYIWFWSTRTSIYLNSNTLGSMLMITLMLMNIYVFTNERFKFIFDKSKWLKIYIFISYIILIFNVLLSGGRTSALGIAISFIPIILMYKRLIIFTAIPSLAFLYINKDKLFLLNKLSRGTSGRSKIWEYVIKEVIPKHPILGVGSGAFDEYVGSIFNVTHMHNSYLNAIASIGFIGFGLWSAVIFFILKEIFILNKNKSIFLFSIVGFMVYSLFELGLFSVLSLKSLLFWTIVLEINESHNGNIQKTNQV